MRLVHVTLLINFAVAVYNAHALVAAGAVLRPVLEVIVGSFFVGVLAMAWAHDIETAPRYYVKRNDRRGLDD